MSKKLRFDGVDYDTSSLSAEGQAQLALLRFADQQISDLKNMQALLRRAKRAYTTDLENEIIKSKTGVDMSSLFKD